MPSVVLLLCSYTSALILLACCAIYRLYSITALMDIIDGHLFFFTDKNIMIHVEQKFICIYVGLVLLSLTILAIKINGLQYSAIVGISATFIYIVFFFIMFLCDVMQRRFILHSLHMPNNSTRASLSQSQAKKTIFDDIPNLHDNPYRNRPANLAEPLTPQVVYQHTMTALSTMSQMLFQREHPSFTPLIDKRVDPALPDLRSGFFFFLNIIALALCICCLIEGIREEAGEESHEKSPKGEKKSMERLKSSNNDIEGKRHTEKDSELIDISKDDARKEHHTHREEKKVEKKEKKSPSPLIEEKREGSEIKKKK